MSNGISYIIPCFNCQATVDESIRSIINGNLENEDEIILVDDGSTDNTYGKLLAYKTQYDFVKVYRHNVNKGTAAAGRNTGIDHSANDLIFCLDSDNILYPNSIKGLKLFLLENKLDVAAFGRIDYFEGSVSNITHQWQLTEKLTFVEALNDPMKTPCGSGNFLYTKSTWKRCGRYNEFLGGAYDSELFGLKLLAESAKFWTLQGTGYLHRQGYESTFIKDCNKKNISLLFLCGLMDYWAQVDDRDVEYIFGKGRLTWMDNIGKRPLRPKTTQKRGFISKILNNAQG